MCAGSAPYDKPLGLNPPPSITLCRGRRSAVPGGHPGLRRTRLWCELGEIARGPRPIAAERFERDCLVSPSTVRAGVRAALAARVRVRAGDRLGENARRPAKRAELADLGRDRTLREGRSHDRAARVRKLIARRGLRARREAPVRSLAQWCGLAEVKPLAVGDAELAQPLRDRLVDDVFRDRRDLDAGGDVHDRFDHETVDPV